MHDAPAAAAAAGGAYCFEPTVITQGDSCERVHYQLRFSCIGTDVSMQ